ncbi:MAG: cytochrome-c peroxidase [Gemmatimonadales bacterium]
MQSERLGRALAATLLVGFLAGCGSDQQPVAPSQSLDRAMTRGQDSLVMAVRALAEQRGITPMPRPPRVRPELVRLGQALAFDKILSGNRDISCMTCHLPAFALGDDRSLSIGQGASGLGPGRVHPAGAFIPRNAPSLFNLTALQSLFWDGRVSRDASGRFHTPAGEALTPAMTRVFEFGPASALGLFPVTSREEMRGQGGNELAAIPDADVGAIWRGLMLRLGGIPEYRRLFEAAYPGTRFSEMTFAHASNAIAGFLIAEYTFTDTPWDRFLAGNNRAMTRDQLTGAQTFLTIKCSICHNGPAFTDNKFHNVAIAQFGPGEGDGPDGHDDFGRMRVTGNPADQYAFRTTPLRNVELTGPYGHDGAFAGLRDFIDHYSESELKLRNFDPMNLEPLLQGTLQPTADAVMLTRDTIINGVVLPSVTVDQLTTFMSALSDPRAAYLERTIPRRVPSGLPVDR